MPIFTMIISLIGFICACIFDKGIILGIAMLIGFMSDMIFFAILAIKDRNKPEPSFIIDYRRTGYETNRYKMDTSKHTRKGKSRRHTNCTTGSHMNGKYIEQLEQENTKLKLKLEALEEQILQRYT